MMKSIIPLLALIGSTAAAPAISWIDTSSTTKPTTYTVHNSAPIELRTVLQTALTQSPPTSTLPLAIFLLQRDSDGNDGLTSHSQSLPTVSSLSPDARTVEHYVRGLDTPKSVLSSVKSAAGTARSVVETTLDEFRSFTLHEFSAEADVSAGGSIVHKRSLSNADLVLVHVNAKACPKLIDEVVSKAVEDETVGSVVLTALRSVEEGKLEKNLMHRARKQPRATVSTHRRRLEDAQEEGDDDGGDSDTAGVYFVNFTPNIFAGLMFFFFFVMVTYTGISCMGMISGGDDYYVTKYPSIGREV